MGRVEMETLRTFASRRLSGLIAGLAAAACSFVVAGPAMAGQPSMSVFARHTLSGAAIPCVAQSDGVRVCTGMDDGGGATDLRLKSFDGSPLALYVALPPGAGRGPYPLVVQSGGWESPTTGPSDTQFAGPTGDQWARQGFAVLELQPRGFGVSCVTAQARETAPSA